ncbi:MAG: hypothetical protein Q4C13_04965 [Clostridia bacterium]|nr:hypothetical protein [Clostridia bacterium]
MKLWAKVLKNQRIIDQAVQEFASARPVSADGWSPVLAALCKPLDLACPVLLPKHVQELARFSRTIFAAQDFMESVDFDRLEIEIFPEKKKGAHAAAPFDAE